MTREQCDFLVVSMHWGLDYTDYPMPFDMAHARTLIDHGAGLIVGHHPHRLQGIEEYRDGVIAYSLGNFIFDEPGCPTGMLDCRISGKGITNYRLIPAKISSDFRPTLADEGESSEIRKSVSSLSSAYGNYSAELAKQMIDRYCYINLLVFRKSRNLLALKNFNSPYMIFRLCAYIIRQSLRKLRFQ
jgi:hypothetical protein